MLQKFQKNLENVLENLKFNSCAILLPNRVNISTEFRLPNHVNMHCFVINLWYVDAIREHAFERLLTRLGRRVAQEMNFDHQKLKDGMFFQIFNIFHNDQYDHNLHISIFVG